MYVYIAEVTREDIEALYQMSYHIEGNAAHSTIYADSVDELKATEPQAAWQSPSAWSDDPEDQLPPHVIALAELD